MHNTQPEQIDLMAAALAEGLAQMEVAVSQDAQVRCIAYLQMMARWNARMNLTAIRDPMAMVTHHLLDSLAVLPAIHGAHCLDVGTGAGLPGIPLALAQPETHWTLLDCRGKKTRFVQQVVSELCITQAKVVHKRVEDFAPTGSFDTIVSRAVADVETFLQWCGHLLHPEGQILLMTGKHQTLSETVLGFSVQQLALEVPALAATRHLICLRKHTA